MAERVRVVHVLDNLNTGGTELNAVRTAERLDRARFDIRFICLQPDGPLRARLDAAGIPVTGMGISGLLSADSLRRGLEIRELVRRERIDVVHAHDPYANVLAAPWVRLAGRGRVIASQRWWKNVHPAQVRVANRIAYRFAHVVLANSPSIAEQVISEEGVPRSRVVVVPNFVDDSGFEPLSQQRRVELRARCNVAPDDIVIGVVANLYPVKNHAMLVRAAARLKESWPRVKFVIVGEGDERQRLAAEISERGLDGQVIMPGRILHEPGLPGVFDIAVLTSREEGFPNFVVEAMAAGRAVVATRVGGVPDAVVHGETGLLVASGDDSGLAAALDRLLREPDTQDRMRVAGSQRARTLFHADGVMTSLTRLYERLASPAV